MLSIEKKKTDKVDLIKPLSKYIKEQFSKEELTNHENVITNLNQQREQIRNIADMTETSKEMVWRYYSVLSSLESRFPISESNVRISFPWTDPYKQRKTSLYSIYFERGSVLFNYGSIHSQIGATQTRTTVDGIKKACNSFQAAAGVFKTLREYISAHPECFASQDFSADSLQLLQTLMLAQAQECVYEKANMDNMSVGIQAKIAAQVADYFEQLGLLLNGNTLKTLVDRQWVVVCLIKHHLYKAICQYKQAQELETKSQIGEQIARLNLSMESLNQVKVNLNRQVTADLKESVDKYTASITKYFELARKDNDTIYHDTVPQAHKLTPIEKKELVKPSPLPELQFNDPFQALIPFSVKEDSAYYNDQKEQLLRKEMDNIDYHNQTAKASLLSMGLPGSIEAQEMGIPKALQEKMDLVRSEKGISNITSLLENLGQLSDEDTNICNIASQILKKEEDEDNEMRTKYQSAWHRTPSYTLTANFNQDLAKYNSHLLHSTKSDGFIKKKFEDNKHLIAALENQQEVLSLLPSNLSPMNQIPEIASLTTLLNDFDVLIANREKLAEKLKEQIKKDDITMKLLNPSKDKQVIYSEEISKYEPLQLQLNDSFLKQQTLLNTIQKENEKFTAGKSKHGNQREDVLQRFANAFKIYNELKSNLDEGIQFYANFQEILLKFKNKCQDFVNEREKERLELVRQINSNVSPYGQSPVNNNSPQQPQSQHQQQLPPQYFSNNVISPPNSQNPMGRPPPYQPQPMNPFVYGQPPPQQPPIYHQPNPQFMPPNTFSAPPPPYGKPPPYYK